MRDRLFPHPFSQVPPPPANAERYRSCCASNRIATCAWYSSQLAQGHVSAKGCLRSATHLCLTRRKAIGLPPSPALEDPCNLRLPGARHTYYEATCTCAAGLDMCFQAIHIIAQEAYLGLIGKCVARLRDHCSIYPWQCCQASTESPVPQSELSAELFILKSWRNKRGAGTWA